ncbi:MAG: IS1595 family transposase [Chloroflexi bacterium]|nr:IS1595 family transposase [Chloroflexota bacterium]MYD49251.1 IS1595 family transposase [Chloroflexota bacterium]
MNLTYSKRSGPILFGGLGDFYEESDHRRLTDFLYIWLSEGEDPHEDEIVTGGGFSITHDGEIIYRDGSELIPEVQFIANREARRSYASDAGRDIISTLELTDRLIPDEEAAIDFVEEAIWEGVPMCPHCLSTDTYRTLNGKPMRHRCRGCRKYFSVKIGTPMERTMLPLRTWIIAIHLMHTGRKGISAIQLRKHLGITYKTSWFLEHRIRKAMEDDNFIMSGIVQIDETYVGPNERWKRAKDKLHDRWQEGKVLVMGFRDHNGRTVLFPMPDTTRRTLEAQIQARIEPGSTIYTDGHQGYMNIPNLGYKHEWVNHSVGEFVDGMATTNGIESCWTLLKRGYVGTFHYMSAKHLHRYCSEFAFRLNSGPGNGLETIARTIRAMVGKRLTWDELVCGPPEQSRDAHLAT